ncbi:DUF2812 domain-containing protein [Dehalobacter sp. DCM]|uniref:DUF2812 domain-containing protein n=1 Tax=Dehalobacter sp. DCM TaxID=2907827 RepID=UPI00308154B5|nr:DUF2812 domain-containing protein [Dehalobacter sp. DCM]
MLKFRLYYDKDAEQDWLQKMCLEGWALKQFFLGFYTFVPCEPGEYNYQIDILDNWHGDKTDYATFMEEAGVEVVGQWWRWVFLRKKAADGPFEMYTDAQSKIAQYRKIKRFFTVFLVIETICFLMELMAAMETGEVVIGALTVLLGIITLALLRIVWKCQWKIEQLRREEI